eukprot:Em0001g2654a
MRGRCDNFGTNNILATGLNRGVLEIVSYPDPTVRNDDHRLRYDITMSYCKAMIIVTYNWVWVRDYSGDVVRFHDGMAPINMSRETYTVTALLPGCELTGPDPFAKIHLTAID